MAMRLPSPLTREQSPLLSRSFVICTAFTIAFGFALVIGARRIILADIEDQKNYDAIGRLEEARASMRNAISSLRAFMLSADATHQQSCLSAVDDAADDVSQFSELSGLISSSVQLQHAMKQTSQRMAALMAERSASGPSSAERLADDPKLSDLNTVVENSIGDQLSQQSAFIDVHRERRQDDFLLTELAFIATLISGGLALGLAGMNVKREALQRRLAEVRHANVKQDLMTIQAMLDYSDRKDEQTGLLNREAFVRILDQEFEKNRHSQIPLSIAIIEVDQMQQIHAVLGEQSANEIFQRVATIIRDSFRQGDVCCRFGDASFAVILPRTNLQNASIASERARSALEDAKWESCNITASFGVAQADNMKDSFELVTRAERAVDYARRTGRNRVTAIRAYLPLSA